MSTPANHRLLVVDDEPDLRTLYELTLLREGYDIETAGTVEEAKQLLAEHSFSAVITDMRLPDGTGLDILRQIESEGRREKAIVITAYGSAENAVSALKAGAYDYLTKPVDLKLFRSVVASALSSTLAPSPTFQPATGVASPSSIVMAAEPVSTLSEKSRTALSRLAGNSVGMQQVRVMIDKVSRSMAPVLLWGESGTGKELVSRAIHDASNRSAQPFIAVNCGAIPEQLLEAEFFGHRKGAFTGANEEREGFFQAANSGTLFLDEIGDLPLAMQSKLLRAIQERAVRPVGATQEILVDVRIISATHKDLQAEVLAGRFRQDLFYRLNVIQITLPALRERLEDLPLLSMRILERIAHESGQAAVPQLSLAAQSALLSHRFPGNVRELENLLHRAVALSGHHMLEPEDLGLATPTPSLDQITIEVPAPIHPMAHMSVDAQPQALDKVALPSDLVTHLDQIERDILVRALEHHRLNRTAAGASLGLSLRQMRYRMARLGVHVTEHGIVLGERFDPDADADPA
ncbi:MAG: sigma-54-dependent Fis family transcriptional regulator [Aquabacterium sp.]|uniref:sigma-54-dependent transcriptional regulator n=1 Tax=Aquabacterium sp. TaxID=1872578 RepID=UPI0025BF5F0D|nr:sigma-54 dependent transcriptional regulator [Aquabacterium sp.]MBI5926214.1 sigma-54-dependent Fis family transcriptional regulator [Aquabacterium sp.]